MPTVPADGPHGPDPGGLAPAGGADPLALRLRLWFHDAFISRWACLECQARKAAAAEASGPAIEVYTGHIGEMLS